MGTLSLTTVPIAYIVLKSGGSPWSVFAVHLVIVIITNIVILGVILPNIKMRIKDYLRYGLMRCGLVAALSLIVPLAIKITFEASLPVSILNIVLTVICTTILCLTLGLEPEERLLMRKKTKEFAAKFKNINHYG
jgi:uncharacterized membrane protein YhaH (DUF805 family)